MNIKRFTGVLKRFADHLRELGEEKAAEAVETILKYVSRCETGGMREHDDRYGHDTSGLLEE